MFFFFFLETCSVGYFFPKKGQSKFLSHRCIAASPHRRLLVLKNVSTCNSPDIEVRSTPYGTLTSVLLSNVKLFSESHSLHRSIFVMPNLCPPMVECMSMNHEQSINLRFSVSSVHYLFNKFPDATEERLF